MGFPGQLFSYLSFAKKRAASHNGLAALWGSRTELEDELQAHNKAPCFAGGSYPAKRGVGLVSRRVEQRRSTDGSELCVVKHVECFALKFQVTLLPRNREYFADGHVVIMEARLLELAVVAVVADVTSPAGALEDPGVEPVIHASLTAGQSSITGLNNTSAANFTTTGEIEVVTR